MYKYLKTNFLVKKNAVSENRQLCKFLPEQDKIGWTTYQRYSFLLLKVRKSEKKAIHFFDNTTGRLCDWSARHASGSGRPGPGCGSV